MSGGHFDYNQYRLHEMADEIERLISRNGRDPEPDESFWRYDYSPQTIKQFRIAMQLLRRAAVYVQRIDWLVSGDDSEESFHDRLMDELGSLDKDEYESVETRVRNLENQFKELFKKAGIGINPSPVYDRCQECGLTGINGYVCYNPKCPTRIVAQ